MYTCVCKYRYVCGCLSKNGKSLGSSCVLPESWADNADLVRITLEVRSSSLGPMPKIGCRSHAHLAALRGVEEML